jgi:PAS domain S-box-containing protein
VKNINNIYINELIRVLNEDPSLFYFLQEKAIDGTFIFNFSDQSEYWLDKKLIKNLGYNNINEIEKLENVISLYNEDFFKIHQCIQNKTYSDANKLKFNLKLKHSNGYLINAHANCKLRVSESEDGTKFKLIAAIRIFDTQKRNLFFTLRQLKRYSHIIEGTNIGLWEWNINTNEIILHPQWSKVLGYSINELVPIDSDIWNRFLHPTDRKKRNYTLRKHIVGKFDFYMCEYRMKHKNGNWIWIKEKGKIVSWTTCGKPEWMTGFHEEISDTKERLLLKKSFIKNAPTAIAMFDLNMNYIAVSQKWLEDYKIDNQEVIGKNFYELTPGSKKIWKDIHQKVLKGQHLKKDEQKLPRKCGEDIWITWEVKPWYSYEEEISGIIMHTANITERKKIEEEAKEKQRFLETILSNINVGIISCDRKGRLTLFNKATREWHGLPPENIDPSEYSSYYGLYKSDGKTPMEIEEIPLLKTLKTGNLENEEMVIKPKKGDARHVTVNGSQLFDTSGNLSGAVIALHDITDRKKAEQRLLGTVSKLEAILEYSTKTIIVGTDNSGKITFLNKGAEQLLGYTQEEILHSGNLEMFHIPEELLALQNELFTTTKKKLQGFELFQELVHKDQSARNWTLKRKDGTTFPVLLTITTIKENHQIAGYLGVGVDISELKRIENEIKSILKIARSQNDRLKNFAHIVSHNLRSHSANIEMLLDLLWEDNPSFKDNEMMQHLYKAGKNLKETISHLNEVVIMNTSVKKSLTSLNLYQYVEKALENINVQANKDNIIINNNVQNNLTVLGVPAYLDSIILNILSNAVKYRDPLKKSYIKIEASIEKNYILLQVIDNGLGIDLVKHRRKLFGMYKTFHSNKEARGIGLFITKNQVEAMDGKIDVESLPGKGTVFKVFLKFQNSHQRYSK